MEVERELYAVEPAASGWKVYGCEEVSAPLPNGPEALAQASRLAWQRHQATGRPTGVKVRMQCGDTVLMSPLG